jgi:ER lumen protein retaining receptor
MVALLGKHWNVFHYLADLSHLLLIVLLRRTCGGISLRTHVLYLVVFVCRYCNDGFFRSPLYNVVFKLFYLCSTSLVIGLITTGLGGTYDKKHDTFSMTLLLIVYVPFALVSMPNFHFTELLWTYSLWLESVVILPQLFLLKPSQRIDNLTKDYIFFLGMYRLFYVLNWIQKAVIKHKTEYVVWVTGIVQTLVCINFLYYYIRAFLRGTEKDLPRSQ